MPRKQQKSIYVNLHGLREFEARARLNEVLESVPADTKIVKVIHGYHGGQTLYNLVRNEYYHYKIYDIVPLFANDGETWYYLKTSS